MLPYPAAAGDNKVAIARRIPWTESGNRAQSRDWRRRPYRAEHAAGVPQACIASTQSALKSRRLRRPPNLRLRAKSPALQAS